MDDKPNKIDNILDLANLYKISSRAKNALLRNEIFSLKKFEDFLVKIDDFSVMNNVGNKTEIELYQFASSILPHLDLSKFIKQKKQYKTRDKYKVFTDKLIKPLIKPNDPEYKLKLYVFYNIQYFHPSVSYLINNKLAEMNILSFIEFFNNFDFKNIKGIGVGKSIEYENFISHLNHIITRSLEDKEYLFSFSFIIDVIDFQCPIKFDEKSMENFLSEDKKYILFFKLLDFLLMNGFFGNDMENTIFLNTLKVINKISKKSMLEISKQFNLTGERIRQLNILIEEKFWNRIEMLILIIGANKISKDYYLDYDEGIYDVNVLTINKNENTDFYENFLFRAIYIILQDKFTPIYLNYKGKEKKYLIDKKYKDINFEKLVDEIETLKNRVDIYKLSINIKDYVAKYSNNQFQDDNELVMIFKHVIESVAGSKADDNYMIDIPRNYRYMYEYAYEVLQEENGPLTLDQMAKRIELRHPGLVKNIDALRGNIQTSDKFIYFGRSSTYGLKEWEALGMVKGGTIKQIVQEFLESMDRPAHISEITEYVTKYRDTNEFNIMGNLKFDRNNLFVFYNSGYVGLTTKTYNIKELKFNKINLNLFKRSFTRMFNNNISLLKYNEFIDELARKNKLTHIQIIAIINKRINKGKLRINDEGYLVKTDD